MCQRNFRQPDALRSRAACPAHSRTKAPGGGPGARQNSSRRGSSHPKTAWFCVSAVSRTLGATKTLHHDAPQQQRRRKPHADAVVILCDKVCLFFLGHVAETCSGASGPYPAQSSHPLLLETCVFASTFSSHDNHVEKVSGTRLESRPWSKPHSQAALAPISSLAAGIRNRFRQKTGTIQASRGATLDIPIGGATET